MKSFKKQFSISRTTAVVAGLLLGFAKVYSQSGIPPKILVQPLDQTVLSGGTAVFTVVAESVSLMTFQWRFNGVKLNGATNITYTPTNLQYTNAGLYSVVITNAVGYAVSSNATLTVINTPLRFVAAGWGSAGFTGQLQGPIGASYVLSVSTNLGNWTPISTNLAITGVLYFADDRSTNRPACFYRATLR